MIEWNDQGVARLHKHERDSFDDPTILMHRTHAGVDGGDLFSTDDGHLMIRDNDGHDRIVGKVSGTHAVLFRQDSTAEDDDSDLEIQITHDDVVAETPTGLLDAPPKMTAIARLSALESNVADIGDMLRAIMEKLNG